jgi:hypothetical protein
MVSCADSRQSFDAPWDPIPIGNVNRLPVRTKNCRGQLTSTCSKVRIISAIPAEIEQELTGMQDILACCCGLDVHKESVASAIGGV